MKCLLKPFAQYSIEQYLFLIDLYESFIYSGCESFVGYILCRYLLPLCDCHFTLFVANVDKQNNFFLNGLCFVCPVKEIFAYPQIMKIVSSNTFLKLYYLNFHI